LRRYWLTIFLLLGLLLVGGLAVVNILNTPSYARGPYMPTLSSDPQQATVEATIFVVSMAVIIGMTIGLGIFLAITFARLNALIAAHWAEISAPAPRSSGTKPAATSQGLPIPFSSNRSAIIFWVVVVLAVVGFQVLRFWNDPRPFGYLPNLAQLASMPVFKLPGSHINGLPTFIAGPGDAVTAAQLLVLTVALALGGVGVLGVSLAKGLERLDRTVAIADKLPPSLPDKLIPMVEQQIQQLRAPRKKRLPGNPIDGMLIAANAVLLLVILGIVAFYVLPSYTGVAAIDQALEATKMAALVTATVAPTAGPSDKDVLEAELAALPPGNATNGEATFKGKGGCVACHSLEPDKVIVGPSQAGVATRAPTRKPGYSPELYIYESITHPNAFVVPSFQPGLMPQDFKQRLTPQEISDLIAYLLTLK
jgi:L-cysteine S-thiosulfotransferase